MTSVSGRTPEYKPMWKWTMSKIICHSLRKNRNYLKKSYVVLMRTFYTIRGRYGTIKKLRQTAVIMKIMVVVAVIRSIAMELMKAIAM